jgi:methyl-accepting chemotaxis protein
VRAKFLLPLSLIVVTLLAVAGLGIQGMARLASSQEAMSNRVPRLKAIAELRFLTTWHRGDSLAIITLGAGNPRLLDTRLAKLKSLETQVQESIARTLALDWDAASRQELLAATAAFKAYGAAFEGALARTRNDKGGTLIEAAMQDGRDQVEAVRASLGRAVTLQEQLNAQAMADADRLNQEVRLTLGAALVLALLGVGFIVNAIARAMEGSVRELQLVMGAVQKGDLRRLPQVEGKDELGQLGAGLAAVITALSADIRSIVEISQRTASGAMELAATAEQLSATTTEISSGAEQQRVAMAQSSTTLQGVMASIGDVSLRLDKANDLSKESLDMAATGLASAHLSSGAMGAIEDSSAKVGRITVVIADIARQTNLLSLNAAIEAAKAGAQGKGFAVVAEEIRKLAERSGAAAKEISALIQESAERVKDGVRSVEGAGSSLASIEANIRERAGGVVYIAKAMQDNALATKELSGAVTFMAGHTERNASATQELASTTQEIARTTEEVSRMANNLHGLMARFTV